MRLLNIVFCWLACAVMAAPATASTILYTDRAAFELAADPNRLITVDGSAAVVELDFPFSTFQVTFDGLLEFTFDLVSGVGWAPGRTSVVMGQSGLSAGAAFLEPVYAFGVDLLGADPSGTIFGSGSGFNFSYSLFATPFIGVVSDQPITLAGITYAPIPTPTQGAYALDNVLVTTVPDDEANTFLLLLLAVGALLAIARVSSVRRAGGPSRLAR